MGEEYAREEGMAVARFPADWSRYGKMAGPRRNGEMARYAMKKGCNGVLIAFLRADSRGTKNMIDTAVKMKLETYVVKYEEKIIEILSEENRLLCTDMLTLTWMNVNRLKCRRNIKTV